MVSIRRVHQDQRPGFDEWLSQLPISQKTKDKLRDTADTPDTLLIGQEMVEILHELQMDDDTLQAALVLTYCNNHNLDEEQISQKFGAHIAALIAKVRKMDAISTLRSRQQQDSTQVERLRNMLLTMVEDVRAVVIKMAERICALHQIKKEDEETRVIVARECAMIYAPLANRLGIGQLKWELEDLSFRYLHPDTYKKIARQLREKRSEREQYILDFVTKLQTLLDEEEIKAEVVGRPKHIFSIYKKMQKKHLSFEQLFDIRALRIIADRLQDCYAALGTVHANFRHIPAEFDDYIATPKPNGYQSIHTVVIGPEGKSIEIQIRTQQMHNESELGVAAHWKYKEGSSGKSASQDERVLWLRKILQWQEEMADSGSLLEEFQNQVFEDRVYVFTPRGDVVDLPSGATPLDFAYYIHSNIGHKCTGAKVNERIVPFTYTLQTGDQVSILTSKNSKPSRDWMHPGLGYVHTARARAAIQSYFKKLDRNKNVAAGRELIERELTKAHLSPKFLEHICTKFNAHNTEELFLALGTGDTKVMSVIKAVQQEQAPSPSEEAAVPKPKRNVSRSATSQVVAEGVGNLLSNLAKCCQPVAGDNIVGFITQGKGISVHKESCAQLQNLLVQHPEREIDVSWLEQKATRFQTQIDVYVIDRDGMLRDITTELANIRVSVLGIQSSTDTRRGTAHVKMTIEVSDTQSLEQAMRKISNVNGVTSVVRQ